MTAQERENKVRVEL